MNRQQKETVVSDFKSMFTESAATFLINYKGLNVVSMQMLRRSLHEVDSKLRITKARLMKKAAEDIEEIKDFQKDFKDQIGLVFTSKETIPVIKKLVSFSEKNNHLEIISGFFESRLITKEEMLTLAKLPSREILLATLIGAIQGPISCLVRTLNTPITQLLYVLKQVGEKDN